MARKNLLSRLFSKYNKKRMNRISAQIEIERKNPTKKPKQLTVMSAITGGLLD